MGDKIECIYKKIARNCYCWGRNFLNISKRTLFVTEGIIFHAGTIEYDNGSKLGKRSKGNELWHRDVVACWNILIRALRCDGSRVPFGAIATHGPIRIDKSLWARWKSLLLHLIVVGTNGTNYFHRFYSLQLFRNKSEGYMVTKIKLNKLFVGLSGTVSYPAIKCGASPVLPAFTASFIWRFGGSRVSHPDRLVIHRVIRRDLSLLQNIWSVIGNIPSFCRNSKYLKLQPTVPSHLPFSIPALKSEVLQATILYKLPKEPEIRVPRNVIQANISKNHEHYLIQNGNRIIVRALLSLNNSDMIDAVHTMDIDPPITIDDFPDVLIISEEELFTITVNLPSNVPEELINTSSQVEVWILVRKDDSNLTRLYGDTWSFSKNTTPSVLIPSI